MDKIQKTFSEKKPFFGFLTAGDGGLDYSLECCLALIEGGVDILEIGFPFSDPVADGPVIQRSSRRALKEGANSQTLLKLAEKLRKKSDIPLGLLSYANPLIQSGDTYLNEAKAAGFDSILVVDLPPEESFFYVNAMKKADLKPIFIVSPSTDEKRLNQICSQAEGFLYYACQKGTTGVRSHLPHDFLFI